VSIIRYLIDRPLVTKLMIIFIFGLALSAILRVQRQGYPRVDMEKMNITTVYPGASPEDVELNVTVKLEEALKEVDGLEKYTSRSMESQSRIQVFIDPDAEDKEKVKQDVRRAIEGVSDLPSEVEDKPYVFEVKVDNFSIYEVALTLPGADEKKLRYHAKELKKRLVDIGNVSKVNESGIRDREIQIQLNRQKMARHFVSFQEVIAAIKQNKLRVSGGSIESFTSEKGIVTFSEFERPEDVEQIIVRASDLGYKVRIKDVGRVVDSFAKDDQIIKYNGTRGMSLWVSKKGTADIISTVDSIKAVVADYQQAAPKDLHIFSTFDESIQTKNRLEIVVSNAILGFLLVVCILFIFLDRTTALWTAAGLPISIALTLIVMPMLDITINSISILGLIVVLGMVVDDAIIISESIYRSREQGMKAKEAALHGIKVVYKPVVGTIITTMIAFIPIYFMPGTIGDFSVEIPSIVIIMLAASLVEASTILPAHLAHAKEGVKKEPIGQAFITLLEGFYSRLLQKSLRRKYLSLAFFGLFLLGGYFLSKLITDFNMFPTDQSTAMSIYGETARGSTLEYTAKEVKKIEAALAKLPEEVIHSYKTVVGRNYQNGSKAPANEFFIWVILTPANQRDMKATDVKAYIQKKYAEEKIDKTIEHLNFFIDSGGPPVGKPIEIRVIGNNNELRLKAMAEIKEDIKKFHAQEVDSDYRIGKDEVRLLPDYGRIATAQLTVEDIANTIRTAFDGTVVTYLQTPEEKVPFRVVLDEASKNFKDPLRGLSVRNQYGRLVDVKNLVRTEKTEAAQNIYHYDGHRNNMITANVNLDKTNPKKVYDQLEEYFEQFLKTFNKKIDKVNDRVKVVLGGEAKESSTTFLHIATSIAAALVAIYFILILQFNSFSQPFMVLLVIPFGTLGITVAFGLHGMPLSMLALIGILGFSGVVINDSLIMVDFINRLKESGNIEDSAYYGQSRELTPGQFNQAIIEGSTLRLRPIVLTTLTTMAGLVPTAYGIIGGLDSFISPMVMAMAWGLLVGTISVLVVIPVLYSVNHDLAVFTRRIFRVEKESMMPASVVRAQNEKAKRKRSKAKEN
jgi:multidrug efflux pump subunit AcrB